MAKRPFEIAAALTLVETAVAAYPKAMLFQLAADGYGTVFQQLVACMLSIRTRDEAAGAAALRLFARAHTPAAVAELAPETLDGLIYPVAFHTTKARQILAIAQATLERHQGELPGDFGVLTGFAGVGPKCANLALGVALGQARIGVDIHVHRITNRWGYVKANMPEQTMAALEARLPQQYWITINRLLVPFGKNLCTSLSPKCSRCPILDMCQQVGVTTRR